MNKLGGILLFVAAIALGVWWWRRSYTPSPLDQQFADLAARAQVGDWAQQAAFLAQPVSTMMGSGWGTTMQVNPSNPSGIGNVPGKLMLNTRFAQPGGF